MLQTEYEQNKPPNIIYILADDLGYGDLSCYGQEKFGTPHIDDLARRGIRFTHHYAGSTVCAPSRSVLMTGLHTGHTPIRGNREVLPEGQAPLPADARTLAECLKEAGYVTGAFGKWGLGFPGSEGDPLKQGFDRFYGYNCQRVAHHAYPAYLWDGDRKVNLPGNDWIRTSVYAPDLIQQEAMEFIRHNKDTTFFLYLPVILPHAELIVPWDSLNLDFRGAFPEEPFAGGPGAAYGPGMVTGQYCSQDQPRATFAGMVQRLDVYVGQISALLRDLGIEEETLVMFSSDNGPHREGGADPDFFDSSGGLRGIKRDLYEGGLRVPLVVSWPGTVEGGRVSGHISAFWDLLPTLGEVAGFDAGETDGLSFLPELLGKEQSEPDFLYWEFHEQGGKQAILQWPWKAVRLNVGEHADAPVELYNLSDDPGERTNLADAHPTTAEDMVRLLDQAHRPSAEFRFGRSVE
ncbi:MAG: arylsulfatase [Bacteroidales bacterium]